MTMRQEATRAPYEGSLADPGDRNPYAVRSLSPRQAEDARL
ncbi:hypothetical protein [Mycobacterium sp. 852002-10029_SCH5224772]|nr:hypothetical protein [Mycobacterium sp. 852002-10029_SCH5224772]